MIRSVFSRTRLPDFLCIGAQKAGTTTLHELLRGHPDAYVPDVKETHFFSRHFDQPLTWYQRQFAAARQAQAVGEVTPYYLFHPAAPTSIAAQLPTARLIVLLRDPVERALSGFFHAKRHGMEPLPIDDAFEAEADRLLDAEAGLAEPGGHHQSHQWHSYVARSRYELQLSRYLRAFPPAQLLLLRSEELFSAPAPAWDRIQRFLGLRTIDLPPLLPHANQGAGEVATVASGLRRRLRQRLETTYETLHQEYGIVWRASAELHVIDAP